jgi:hypothetical protein
MFCACARRYGSKPGASHEGLVPRLDAAESALQSNEVRVYCAIGGLVRAAAQAQVHGITTIARATGETLTGRCPN